MNTALLLLDYIVDISHPEGKVARSAAHVSARGAVAKANQALAVARSRGWLTVLVKIGFSPSYREQPKQSPMFGRAQEFRALELGGVGTAFHPALQVEASDLVIVKPRVSAFYGTPLEPALRAGKIERLVIAGVSTTWAVQSTVRDGHDRDYQVVILEDACAAADDADHRQSIDTLQTIARIIDVAELERL
ncbi:cysteine hydrolase family protein [Bradyrhizobium erythrophlei]|uniref:cysteine hydrolase family protein n=1 Tax=Bradyrhizobium erythrophlei TaxID=1437360 RepID=UPI0035F038C3